MARKAKFPAGANTASLPEGTDTEEWRLMSARVAWIWWLTERRRDLGTHEMEEADAWKDAAEGQRAYIRQVLRHLAREGLYFVENGHAPLSINSDEWYLASSRVAWMAWLTKHRAAYVADENIEREMWGERAEDQRTIARKVLTNLAEAGIHLSHAPD